VADGVRGAIEARALAEPEANDALMTPPLELAEQLGTGDRGRRELFV
jgi:hypothetical protein